MEEFIEFCYAGEVEKMYECYKGLFSRVASCGMALDYNFYALLLCNFPVIPILVIFSHLTLSITTFLGNDTS